MDLYEFTDKSTLRKAENRIKTFENLIDIFDKQLECDKHTKSLVFQYIQENLYYYIQSYIDINLYGITFNENEYKKSLS